MTLRYVLNGRVTFEHVTLALFLDRCRVLASRGISVEVV